MINLTYCRWKCHKNNFPWVLFIYIFSCILYVLMILYNICFICSKIELAWRCPSISSFFNILNYCLIGIFFNLCPGNFWSIILCNFYLFGLPDQIRSFYLVFNTSHFIVIVLCYFKPPHYGINNVNGLSYYMRFHFSKYFFM